MSDSCLHIVPIHRGDYPAAAAKAREVLEWFIASGFVEAESSDCVLGTGPGHRFRPGIEAAFEPSALGAWFFDDLQIFGLEIHAGERRVFHPLEGADLSLECGACGRVHDFAEATSFIPGWFDGSDETPACLGCGHREHLAAWACTPDWGFSNLGVTLWNSHWEPNEALLRQMRTTLGTEIRVVHSRL